MTTPINTQNLDQMALRVAITQMPAILAASISADLLSKWNAEMAKPVLPEVLVEGMEAAYAAMKADETLAPNICVTLGQIAYLVTANGWWDQGKNGRAWAIYQACRRANGETMPDGSAIPGVDPDVAAKYLPTPAPVMPAPPAA